MTKGRGRIEESISALSRQLSQALNQSTKMRAYYFDNVEGDQRLPHVDSSRPDVTEAELKRIDIKYWHIPIDTNGNWEQVSSIACTGHSDSSLI